MCGIKVIEVEVSDVASREQKCPECSIKGKKRWFIIVLRAVSPTFSRSRAPAADKKLIATGCKCGVRCSEHWRFFSKIF